jgi:hypothetical protein
VGDPGDEGHSLGTCWLFMAGWLAEWLLRFAAAWAAACARGLAGGPLRADQQRYLQAFSPVHLLCPARSGWRCAFLPACLPACCPCFPACWQSYHQLSLSFSPSPHLPPQVTSSTSHPLCAVLQTRRSWCPSCQSRRTCSPSPPCCLSATLGTPRWCAACAQTPPGSGCCRAQVCVVWWGAHQAVFVAAAAIALFVAGSATLLAGEQRGWHQML